LLNLNNFFYLCEMMEPEKFDVMTYNLFLDDFRRPEDAFNYMRLPIYNLED